MTSKLGRIRTDMNRPRIRTDIFGLSANLWAIYVPYVQYTIYLGPDATNCGNWHWVEKDATGWSRNRLTELLTKQTLKSGPIDVEFKDFNKLEGLHHLVAYLILIFIIYRRRNC
jgi:hypothetical protein